MCTTLTNDGIRKLISNGYHGTSAKSEDEKVVVQVIMYKVADETANAKIKARMMVSDGIWAIIAILSAEVFDKMVRYFIQ